MIRQTCAALLSALAFAGAWAQEKKPPAPAPTTAPAAPPAPTARPHRWTIPPIEMDKRRQESEAQEARRQECARLAASADLAQRQQAQVLCGGGTGMAMIPNPPAPLPPPPSPTPVTTCDPAGCWDVTGSRYNGSTSTMIRSDGKICQQIGTMMHCN